MTHVQLKASQLNQRLAADRTAVTALEYGIVCAFFAVGLVTIFANFGSTLVLMFNRATNGI